MMCLMAAAVLADAAASAQEVDPAASHPLFPPMARFHAVAFEQNYDAVDCSLAAGKKTIIEGECTRITYALEDEAPAPTEKQILNKYNNLVARQGGRTLFTGTTVDGYATATLRLVKGTVEYWAIVQPFDDGRSYYLTVIEREKRQ
jgi:hypothetical protein